MPATQKMDELASGFQERQFGMASLDQLGRRTTRPFLCSLRIPSFPAGDACRGRKLEWFGRLCKARLWMSASDLDETQNVDALATLSPPRVS
jgi:hypothetical protein